VKWVILNDVVKHSLLRLRGKFDGNLWNNPLVPSVLLKGRYKKLDVKKTPFNIQMNNVSLQSPEALSNRTIHVLP